MPDINYWLDRKYANMENQTANSAADVASQAGLRGAQAGLVGQQTESGRLANIPGQLMETEALPGARSYLQGLGSQGAFASLTGNPSFGSEMGMRRPQRPVTEAVDIGTTPSVGSVIKRLSGYRDGTAQVMKDGKTKVVDKEGNGHPRVDTVPAMLAEGEAVLNVGAAERMGRDNIKQLNQQGLRDMKMGEHARPTIKKGGRLGAFSGIEMVAPKMGYAGGTNFARTSPDNDAEYHPTEYREPRDPEHDAEHMAQPLSSGGMGVGLRDGSVMVMKVKKYADGTSDAGGHGTPDSPGAVNNAGVTLRRYAAGTDNVPGESSIELENFARQRARNQLSEAVPTGNLVENEPAGEQASVTPSRNDARLRQMFGLTAQGFADGTAAVQAPQPGQDPDTVYAAEGDNFISRAKNWVGGLRGSAAPVDLGAVGGTGEAAPVSASADQIAAKQAQAAQTARMAMGETPAQAAQGLRQPAMQAAAPVSAAAPADLGSAYRNFGQQDVGKTVVDTARRLAPSAQTLGKVVTVGGKVMAPVGAVMDAADVADVATDPNMGKLDVANEVAGKTAKWGAATLGAAKGGAVGAAVGGPLAPFTAPLGAVIGGLGGYYGADQAIKTGRKLLGTEVTDPSSRSNGVMRNTLRAEDVAQAAPVAPAAVQAPAVAPSAAAGKPARMTDAEYYQSGLRGLATMGSMMGSQGSQTTLRDITDREAEVGRNTRQANELAAAQAKAAGKTEDVKFFDPPKIDPKTGQPTAAIERPDLKADFEGRYLPNFARTLQKTPALMTSQDKANAVTSFNLNRAAQNYGLASGKGFDFKEPIDPTKTQFVSDLPAITQIIGRARGENTWREGIWDKGGIVITDGREKQILPVEFLDESGAMSDPAMSQLVKTLKARSQQK